MFIPLPAVVAHPSTLWHTGGSSCQRSIAPRLRSLNLCSSSLVPVPTWLQSFNHLTHVGLMTLPRVADTPFSAVRKTLQQLGGALHHLDITLIDAEPWRFFPIDMSAMVDLSLHSNLRTLIIRDASATLNLGDLISLMRPLDASAFERLLLVIVLTFNVDAKWADLDLFSSSARFPCLSDFSLKHEHWTRTVANVDNTAAFMRTLFPSLTVSGVFRLDLG
ncbi:hypothetical protein C8R45DRAFT_1020409 [Mycena sanguinolenta]|nr:hypothetical protein C8R45DRAFT_1020409 [Mycena sanguinolenta]